MRVIDFVVIKNGVKSKGEEKTIKRNKINCQQKFTELHEFIDQLLLLVVVGGIIWRHWRCFKDWTIAPLGPLQPSFLTNTELSLGGEEVMGGQL